MLCSTCYYDSDEGFCGLGSKLVAGECSGYIEGKKAAPLVVLPPHIRVLVRSGTYYLRGIPFLVRGHSENTAPGTDYMYEALLAARGRLRWGCDHDGMFTTTHTIALLPGDRGYQVLHTSLGQHVMHPIEAGGNGGLSIAINGRYSRGGGPILVEVSLRTVGEYPDLATVDLMPYIWWLDHTAPDYAVEYYLQGLMALYAADLMDIYQVMEVKAVPLRTPLPWNLPSAGDYSVITYRGEQVREYLLAKYVQHTKYYRHLTMGVVEHLASKWDAILNGCRQRYVKYR